MPIHSFQNENGTILSDGSLRATQDSRFSSFGVYFDHVEPLECQGSENLIQRKNLNLKPIAWATVRQGMIQR